MIANEIKEISEVYRLIKAIHVDMSTSDAKELDLLKDKLGRFPGKIPVYLQLDTKDYKSVEIKVGRDLYVSPSEILMDEIKQLIGEDRFSVKI